MRSFTVFDFWVIRLQKLDIIRYRLVGYITEVLTMLLLAVYIYCIYI
jgi:hypothetical protein